MLLFIAVCRMANIRFDRGEKIVSIKEPVIRNERVTLADLLESMAERCPKIFTIRKELHRTLNPKDWPHYDGQTEGDTWTPCAGLWRPKKKLGSIQPPSHQGH